MSIVLCAGVEKFKLCQGGALNFDQAQPAPKQLNLKSLAPLSPKTHRLWGGVQAGSKFSGCPTPAEFNLLAVRQYIGQSKFTKPDGVRYNKLYSFS